jgi:hypothetical protein
MTSVIHRLLLGAMIAPLAACDNSAQRAREQAAARNAEELALMRDVSRAAPEIERRLREHIQSNGTIVVITKEFGSWQAMPATTAWTVTCGLGLSVTIAAAGDNEGISLEISDAFLGEADCRTVLPLTATKVADLFAGK